MPSDTPSKLKTGRPLVALVVEVFELLAAVRLVSGHEGATGGRPLNEATASGKPGPYVGRRSAASRSDVAPRRAAGLQPTWMRVMLPAPSSEITT